MMKVMMKWHKVIKMKPDTTTSQTSEEARVQHTFEICYFNLIIFS
jgi:hypothetical protein